MNEKLKIKYYLYNYPQQQVSNNEAVIQLVLFQRTAKRSNIINNQLFLTILNYYSTLRREKKNLSQINLTHLIKERVQNWLHKNLLTFSKISNRQSVSKSHMETITRYKTSLRTTHNRSSIHMLTAMYYFTSSFQVN